MFVLFVSRITKGVMDIISCSLRKWYGDSVDNIVEEHSSAFSLIRMHWLPSARACGQ